MPLTLADLRRRAGHYLTLYLWLHVPLVAVVGLLAGTSGWFVPLSVAALAGVATLEYRRNPMGHAAAMTISAALAIVVALMVYEMRATAWQADMHMYFFATFAMMAVFCNWRPIVLFAGVVAVHHLGLNVLLTAAVFPGEADLWRVLLHAVILITQAGVMLVLNVVLARMFAATEAALAEAAEARRASEALGAERDLVQAEQEQAMRVIEAALDGLAKGNLDGRIEDSPGAPFPATYAALRTSFNAVAAQLSDTIGTFEASVRDMLATSDAIAEAADLASRGVEAQSVTLSESASSLRGINDSVAASAALANQAEASMQQNQADATAGGEVLMSAVVAMKRIEKSSSEIHQIVEVIEDIAFQTNLLALNAGVEAGRAGEAGRGFAVVATEVRALAQRASASAKDIRKRIEESRAYVLEGSALVERTSSSLATVIKRAAEVASIMSHINVQISQQNAGLLAIMNGVSDIEQATRRTAAEAEGSREISTKMTEQASHLMAALEAFTSDRPPPQHSRQRFA